MEWKCMYACVYAHSWPHLNPSWPRSLCDRPVLHLPCDNTAISTASPPQRSSSKSPLLVFHSFVLNYLPPPLVSMPPLLLHCCIPFFLPFPFHNVSVPTQTPFPLTSHRMVMYFRHPSPDSVDPNVSICPRDHEVSIGITCCSGAENFTPYK